MDTVGHFADATTRKVEWMVSGAGFTQGRFTAMANAIAERLGGAPAERLAKVA